MAESTRSMRKSVLDRDILSAFNKRLVGEIHEEDLRALCMRVRARCAPATAVHIRDLLKQIYGYANLHGEKVVNPAEVGDDLRQAAGDRVDESRFGVVDAVRNAQLHHAVFHRLELHHAQNLALGLPSRSSGGFFHRPWSHRMQKNGCMSSKLKK